MSDLNWPLPIPPRADPAFRPFVLACALLALLAAQLLLPVRDDLPDTVAVAPRQPRPVTVPALPETPAILARPLFVPGRTPDKQALLLASDEVQPTASVARYALVGVSMARDRTRVFLKAPGGKLLVLGAGAALEGWRIAAVAQDAVLLSRDNQRIRLPVQASTAPPAAALPESNEPQNETATQ